MGRIFSGLAGRDGGSSAAMLYSNVHLNLKDPSATPSEQPLVAHFAQLLSRCPEMLAALRNYRGSQELVKLALTTPTPENEEAAWASLAPDVMQLQEFFEFARAIETSMPELLQELCTPSADSSPVLRPQDPADGNAVDRGYAMPTTPVTPVGVGDGNNNSSGMASVIVAHQALVKQFADILSFAFEFDELKMAAPSIQNDFAFYKRTSHRMMKSNSENVRKSVMSGDITNRMSLFFAYHNPMFRVVIDTITQFINRLQLTARKYHHHNPSGAYTTHSQQYPGDNGQIPRISSGGMARSGGGGSGGGSNPDDISESIAVLCGGCYNALTKKSPVNADAVQFYLRVMVSCAVLYDQITPHGVFVKSSPIGIPSIVQAIQINSTSQHDTLLNALRFSTKHLNDPTTPKRTKDLLLAQSY
ncbi:DUF1394-domain-containing protein [Ramicandelaber brevisporus]|nr:DUF1394-domain-containing protein [Ramicandelaber brevisporus]